jgi:uncharacterized protein (UPF0333 family)
MNKGQISFDFIFALIAVIVLISTITLITQSISENQTNSAIYSQAKKISLETARIISLTETIQQYDYEIEYFIPKIIVPGQNIPLNCEITVNSNKVKVTAGNITAITPIKRTGLASELKFYCGEKMVIE